MKLTTLLLFAFFAAKSTSTYVQIDPRDTWEETTLDEDLPDAWYWGDVEGTNYLTKNLNQHIPQYCGSCWAHGALSSLADRVKIARNATHPDINLPVQFLLNCGNVGSCRGGDPLAAYRYIHEIGGIPFDTCLNYEACSYNSIQDVCKNRNFTCKPENICRACSSEKGCVGVAPYPNVTIASYGAIQGWENMMNEIYKHGPIACGVDAHPLDDYQGGIIDIPNNPDRIDHIISVAGWGYDNKTKQKYWIVRNSWGEYWGELGFFRIILGKNSLGIEGDCVFAHPGNWTKHNKPCDVNAANCIA